MILELSTTKIELDPNYFLNKRFKRVGTFFTSNTSKNLQKTSQNYISAFPKFLLELKTWKKYRIIRNFSGISIDILILKQKFVVKHIFCFSTYIIFFKSINISVVN